jgi:tetratricopeptide (TPR) repeat protein
VIRAREQLRHNAAIARGLADQDPSDPIRRRDLAECDRYLGRAEQELGHGAEAAAAFRRSRALAEANLRCGLREVEEWARRLLCDDLSFLLLSLAGTASEEAVAEGRHVLELIDSLPKDDPSKASLQTGMAARVAFLLAVREDRVDQAAAALRDFRRAVELFRRLQRAAPLSIKDRATLGTALHNIGRLHVEAGRPGDALGPYREAIAIREALHRADAENSLHRSDCGGSWHRMGEALRDLARYDEALEAYRKGIAYRRPLIARMPGEIRYRKGLDESCRDLARLARRMGRLPDAAEAARERRALWPDDPAVALAVAGELIAAAVLVRPGESPLAAARDEHRHRCVALAFEAARDAARIAARKSRLAESSSGPPPRTPPGALR